MGRCYAGEGVEIAGRAWGVVISDIVMLVGRMEVLSEFFFISTYLQTYVKNKDAKKKIIQY